MKKSIIGSRIKTLRLKAGLTCSDLASRIKVSEEAIKKIERGGSHSPTFQNGLLLSRALHADPWAIAFGGPEPTGYLPVLQGVIDELRDRADAAEAKARKRIFPNGVLTKA